MSETELQLTELIDTELLKQILDLFSQTTGFAALTIDSEGEPVFEGVNFSEFCKLTRASHVGGILCQQCDKYWAQAMLDEGEVAPHRCHAGLLEFSAPIIANGNLVGSFVGGQVLASPPNEDLMRQVASAIGINPEEYVEAVRKIKICPKEQIESAANFLFSLTNVISDMAYGKHMAIKAGEEVQKAATMKSNFLANMSHEIRTPMNAVIGMAELALREDLSPAARNYINQIKTSGNALLSIINDILDFSKIESGKMDIIPEEYEPVPMFNDVANIIMTRIQDKDIELILNITPYLPEKLSGDSKRIRQILINLLNNASKFTNQGMIRLSVDFNKTEDDDVIELLVCVEDTGIGIKEEDLDKIFNSFQQVDSKKNRNVEGTGLGLSISQQLVSLMGGRIWVESEYDKGSKFFFSIPQEVISETSCLSVKNTSSLAVIGLTHNEYLIKQFKKDLARLQIPRCILPTSKNLESYIQTLIEKSKNREIYFFIDQHFWGRKVENVLNRFNQIKPVLVTDFFNPLNPNMENVIVVKKPLSIVTMSRILNREENIQNAENDASEVKFDFIAPDARILIVDDNQVNLTVAEGLLEPLEMKIDCVLSGKAAIQKASEVQYDIIFMDHMMPEMDGIMAAHGIRQIDSYKETPIIALTANAVGNVKEMFLREGLNDFVPKPVEIGKLVSMVKSWLPQEKIKQCDEKSVEEKQTQSEITIGDLDTKTAIKMLGNEKLYMSVLKDYYKVIPKKIESIKNYEVHEDWKAYTIEVHALKSSSKQIGAMELSKFAANLEKAGNAKDEETIHIYTDIMLNRYKGYIDVLKPFCEESVEQNELKEPLTADVLEEVKNKMKDGIENLDTDIMEECISKLGKYQMNQETMTFFEKLKDAVENIDFDECEAVLTELHI